MTQNPEFGSVPQFDLADRMRKALRTAGVGVQEMADYLGVSRNTVGTWINGKIDPSKQSVRLWALRTGVPFEWLLNGEIPSPDGPGGDQSTDFGLKVRSSTKLSYGGMAKVTRLPLSPAPAPVAA